MTRTSSFEHLYRQLRKELLESKSVDVGSWHSQSVKGNPMLVTMEVPWINFGIEVPFTSGELRDDLKPNMPWAEEHFQERVGGDPVNPPPSHVNWPWNHGHHQTLDGEKFSHTYPERFWPKWAGATAEDMKYEPATSYPSRQGIRFPYGDLEDVVNLMREELYTRQAYLPVFFPEDTGGQARIKERIPCSMGYHFMVRRDDGELDFEPADVMDVGYTMRSCDFVRHFRDDMYMAARLMQWMCMRLTSKFTDKVVLPGTLRVNIGSLHAMEGDRYKLTEEEKKDGTRQES